MARMARISYPGAIYHVTVRRAGDMGRAVLFRDDADRMRFIERLADRVVFFDVRLYAFCLMDTHLHLVLETPRANLSAFMQGLTTSYTTYFNLRHRRRGHLTAGRFQAKLVDGDTYLLSLSRYVHLNPVHTKQAEHLPLEERLRHLRRYRWSSYRTYVGSQGAWGFVSCSPLLAQCGRGVGEQRREYRRFVEGSLAEEDEDLMHAMKASSLCIGDKTFRDEAKERYLDAAAKRHPREDVSLRQVVDAPDPSRILEVAATLLEVAPSAFRERRRGSCLRGFASYLLCKHGGLTQRKTAEVLGMSTGVAVAAQLKTFANRHLRDKAIRCKLEQAEAILAHTASGEGS